MCVWWSDECSIQRGSGKQPIWVFRTPGEKWLEECLDPQLPKGTISIIIWAAFAGKQKGIIRILRGNPNIRRGGIRKEDILQLYQETLPQMVENNEVFMQDNAPVHTAYVVRDWLALQEFKIIE